MTEAQTFLLFFTKDKQKKYEEGEPLYAHHKTSKEPMEKESVS